MELTEEAFKKLIVTFGDDIHVLRACPNCGRFLKTGSIFLNGLEEIATKNWICKKCGNVKPTII